MLIFIQFSFKKPNNTKKLKKGLDRIKKRGYTYNSVKAKRGSRTRKEERFKNQKIPQKIPLDKCLIR